MLETSYATKQSQSSLKNQPMSSSAYLYSLLNNDGVVRRDLPQSVAVPNISIPTDAFELNALATRARASARNFEFRNNLQPAQPQNPRLIPSADGKITGMLLTVPVGNTAGDFAAIYDKLFETLPSHTDLLCLVNTGSKSAVDAWIQLHNRANAAVVEAPDHVGFSIWAQDGYAISQTSTNDTYFIEPLSFLRYADAVISDYVSNATSLKNFQTPLYFQGGNILIGDDFWFIGIDYPTNTLEYVNDSIIPNPGETGEQLVRRLYKEYLDNGRTLQYVGSTVPVPSESVLLTQEQGTYYVDLVYQGNKSGTAQPLFHIDMFLTLAGRDQNSSYQILVADPSLSPATPWSASGAGYSMQNVFDNIANNLLASGYTVIRNPLPLTFTSRMLNVSVFNRPNDPELYAIYTTLTSAGVAQVELRSWYFATANNALVQSTTDAENRKVWLPTYGHNLQAPGTLEKDYSYLQASDNANKQIWENLGFHVEMLPSFHRLARGLGAVHCIQKYVSRG
jgi:hypothetical protein